MDRVLRGNEMALSKRCREASHQLSRRQLAHCGRSRTLTCMRAPSASAAWEHMLPLLVPVTRCTPAPDALPGTYSFGVWLTVSAAPSGECLHPITAPMRVKQDPDQAALAILDLSRRRPPASANGAAAAERCECVCVDAEHFRARPGLRVLQMAWHPGRANAKTNPIGSTPTEANVSG